MKVCKYCGHENGDDAVHCSECGTEGFEAPASNDPPSATPPSSEFPPLTAQDMEQGLVTLMTCRTLPEADLVVSRLASIGINAFIPDQFLLLAVSWNLNSFGYVRVQVSSMDYEAAKEFLLAPGEGVNGATAT